MDTQNIDFESVVKALVHCNGLTNYDSSKTLSIYTGYFDESKDYTLQVHIEPERDYVRITVFPPEDAERRDKLIKLGSNLADTFESLTVTECETLAEKILGMVEQPE